MPPTVPINHYFDLKKPTNRSKSYSIIPCWSIQAIACLKHSNFFTVNCRFRPPTSEGRMSFPYGWPNRLPAEAQQPTGQKFNYELFNCNNFNIRYWSWNYRGCWHQTCPPVEFVKGFKLYSFQLQDPKEPCISIYCHYLPVSGLGNSVSYTHLTLPTKRIV